MGFFKVIRGYMAGNTTVAVVRDAYSLWQELKKSGLSTKKKSGGTGYDAALEAELKMALFPHSRYTLDRELKSGTTTTEAFLEVFFRSVQPFSMMLADILAMFEEASAKQTDTNLKISFEFDKASPPLAMLLETFRETTEVTRRITRPVVRYAWNSNLLWMMDSAAKECLEELGVPKPAYFRRWGNDKEIISRSPVEEWCARHAHRTWLRFPGFSRAANHLFADIVSHCESVVHASVDACMEVGPSYDDLSRSFMLEREMADISEDARMRSQFRHASHDFWANSFAARVEALILYIEGLPSRERLEISTLAADHLQDVLDQVPSIPSIEVALERAFLDFINLPIWKRRHEVYAVWVGSRVMQALPDHSRRWHPDHETLRFPFSGAHLATLDSAVGDVQFWTELRTSLGGTTGVFGRKAIQPDFRLVAAPAHRQDATILVVECKQYLKGVSSWFAGALDDYSLGCPAAQVVLVNYGTIPDGTLGRVDALRRDRCHAISDMRPDRSESLAAFEDIVKRAVPFPNRLVMPKGQELFSAGIPYKIVANWEREHQDIDLHLVVTDKESGERNCINYGSYGNGGDFPWACLEKDIRSPPGGETISFTKTANAVYDVFASIYSGQESAAPGTISVEIEGSSGTAVFKWPAGRPGKCWYVCWFDEEGIVHVVNRVYNDLPLHATHSDR